MSRWFSKAVREPGHPQAHGYPGITEPRPKRGLVYHSAEGPLRVMRRIIQAPGPPSWTFSNPKRGRLIQHHPRGTNIWANGSLDANVAFDACESEGVAGEPLTTSQIQNLIDLARWYKKEEGWAAFKRREQAWEHLEMTRFGAPPTACPSGRIPWTRIIRLLEEEDDMPDLQVRNRLAVAGVLREAAAYADRGKKWPASLKQKVKAVVALAG